MYDLDDISEDESKVKSRKPSGKHTSDNDTDVENIRRKSTRKNFGQKSKRAPNPYEKIQADSIMAFNDDSDSDDSDFNPG